MVASSIPIKGVDPALVSGGFGFKARLFVVQYLFLYRFTYLANMAATPQTMAVAALYCGGSTHHLAANQGSN